MFYCKECGDKRKWPDGLVKSEGVCEICGRLRVCSDIATSRLPKLEYYLTIKNHNTKKEVKETYESYSEAYKNAEIATKIANVLLELTRPSSVGEIISQCDRYADIYNEMSIIISNSEDES